MTNELCVRTRAALLAGFSSLSLLLMITLFSHAVLAQSSRSNWDVVQRLRPGSKLTIKTKMGQKLKGKMTGATADSVSLSAGKTPGTDVELRREDVAEVRRKSGAQTAGYAALLGGLGLAGGYGIGYGIGEATDSRVLTEYPGALIGAVAGAVAGAIIGSKGTVIYKVP